MKDLTAKILIEYGVCRYQRVCTSVDKASIMCHYSEVLKVHYSLAQVFPAAHYSIVAEARWSIVDIVASNNGLHFIALQLTHLVRVNSLLSISFMYDCFLSTHYSGCGQLPHLQTIISYY